MQERQPAVKKPHVRSDTLTHGALLRAAIVVITLRVTYA